MNNRVVGDDDNNNNDANDDEKKIECIQHETRHFVSVKEICI